MLRYPAENLRSALQENLKELRERREDKIRVRQESEGARKFFGEMVRETLGSRGRVEDVDLEGAPGIAGGL